MGMAAILFCIIEQTGRHELYKRAKMALYRSPDYQINWPFGSEEEVQKDFQGSCHGGHLGFLIRMIFFIFVTLMLPTNFGVNMSFGSGTEAKNRFWRWRPWRPSSFSDQNDFSYFDLLITRCFPIKAFLAINFQDNQPFHYENTPIQIYWKLYNQKKKKKKKKKENFQIKISDIFHMSAQNTDCVYSLEPPRRGDSNEYSQSMFLSRNKKK